MHTTVVAAFPRAVKDFETLLKFLANEEEYTAHLKALTAAAEDMRKEREALGTFEEIEHLHFQAKAVVEQAKAEAEKLVEDATTNCTAKWAELNAAKAQIEAEDEVRTADLNKWQAAIAEREKAVLAREQAAKLADIERGKEKTRLQEWEHGLKEREKAVAADEERINKTLAVFKGA